MTFEEVKKDYQELIGKCGVAYDMTGGFVDAEHMEKVILNPTKANAKKYMIDVINYGFQMGEFWNSEEGEVSINDNETAYKMYHKYVL